MNGHNKYNWENGSNRNQIIFYVKGKEMTAAPLPPRVLVAHLHTVNIVAEFMTDWEIGNFAASGLDKTSTYQMREHCDLHRSA